MKENATYRELYPELFMPLTVRNKVIKNRIVSAPQSACNLYRACGEEFYNFTETAAQYYGAIARGGAGVVHTGHLAVDPRFWMSLTNQHFNFRQTRTTHDTQLPVLHLMTELIHSYGALAGIELNHGGSQDTPLEGNKVLGPSGRKLESGLEVVAMDEAEMDTVADYFAQAALIGVRGGFDIILVHAAHSWLLGQFLSPLNNQRTDRYGGSPENRARFPRMVLERIRKAVGPEAILQIRFSASEIIRGGITMEDAVRTVQYLEDCIDIVQCSAGKINIGMSDVFLFPMNYMEPGINTYLAKEMRRHVNIPVETVGAINTPELAGRLVADGTADLVAMARSFVADPNWAEKARLGRGEDIRPCIRCLKCMKVSLSGQTVCSVNPRRVLPHPLPPVERQSVFTPKQVWVIGGGPGGMTAAQELAYKGHHVTLFEKSDRLGGQLGFSEHVAFKRDVKRYKNYLIGQMERDPNIEIRLNTEVTPALVELLRPDSVVVAIGAQEYAPPIPGADKPHVRFASEVYGREDELGGHVVVVGGGFVGCETCIHLHTLGKTVDLVEMADELIPTERDVIQARNITIFYVNHELDMARRSLEDVPEADRVKIHTATVCREIRDDGVVLAGRDGTVTHIAADSVVLAVGSRVDRQKRDRFYGTAYDVIPVGDCRQVGSILTATASALSASLQI